MKTSSNQKAREYHEPFDFVNYDKWSYSFSIAPIVGGLPERTRQYKSSVTELDTPEFNNGEPVSGIKSQPSGFLNIGSRFN
jgi:hypothetical protein